MTIVLYHLGYGIFLIMSKALHCFLHSIHTISRRTIGSLELCSCHILKDIVVIIDNIYSTPSYYYRYMMLHLVKISEEQ